MALSKRYLKSKPVCKVTFKLGEDAVPKARRVHVVGDFNNWNPKATPMTKLKTGGYSATLDLESGRSYQFRYLVDGKKYENDWSADEYVRNPFGDEDNSVVKV